MAKDKKTLEELFDKNGISYKLISELDGDDQEEVENFNEYMDYMTDSSEFQVDSSEDEEEFEELLSSEDYLKEEASKFFKSALSIMDLDTDSFDMSFDSDTAEFSVKIKRSLLNF
jgi:hypothetical protein